MSGLSRVERAETLTREDPPRCVHRVLVGHGDEVTPGGRCGELDQRVAHSFGEIGERLRAELEVFRMSEIRLHLAGPGHRQVVPRQTSPACAEVPFRQPLVHRDLGARCCCDEVCRLPCTFQGRRDEATHGGGGEVATGGGGLAATELTEPEPREVRIDDVIGVVDFPVADETDAVGGHGDQSSAMSAPPNRPFAERFLHVDMDAFYVEVERQRDPTLRGVPVVVGGLGPRGVVAAASYEARGAGVRSAMPIVEARRRLPLGRYLPPDHRAYGEVSAKVFEVLRAYTPYVESLSVDEAFLDVAGLRLHYESPAAVGAAIREHLRTELGLPASVGAATTKFLAKLASEDAKPDGILVIDAGCELEYLHPLQVRRLWGVGAATHAALEALGVTTIGDLAALPERVLVGRLGPSNGAHLAELAAGRDPRRVETTREAKSISVEETYARDLRDTDDVETALLDLCTRLSGRLHRAGVAGRTVTLKLRTADFATATRSVSPDTAVMNSTELWDIARTLLERIDVGSLGIRLLGVGVSHLEEASAPHQLSITDQRRAAAAETAEAIRARFGAGSVVPARLVRERSRDPEKGPNP